MSNLIELNQTSVSPTEWPRRVNLFGIEIHAVNLAEAVSELVRWTKESDGRMRYVVTPNVDHIVMLQQNEALRAAYEDASLILADGWPVVAASRWLGRPLPERVAGSDLVPALFNAVRLEVITPELNSGAFFHRDPDQAEATESTTRKPLRVFLMGAGPGVAQRASQVIHSRWPGVRVVGVDSPAIGFEHRADENHRLLSLIADADPDVLVVGLGAPKQELWVHKHRESIAARVTVCAGATIDFLAGEKQRAPLWMRRCGLEWFHRVVTEPRRLARRYLKDAVVFPRLVWNEWRSIRV